MSAPSKELTLTVDSAMAAKVIGLWWVLSLLVVRGLLELPLIAPLLEAVRQAIPAVQMYAHASGFEAETTGFYCFFLVSTPFVAVQYFKFMALKRPMKSIEKLITWFLILLFVFFMTMGIDLGPRETPGLLRMFHALLTSSWFGSSFIFLLVCHVALTAVACISKDKGRRFS